MSEFETSTSILKESTMDHTVDQQKRRTLKGVAAVTGATLVGTLSTIVSAESAPSVPTETARQVWPPVKSSSQLTVKSRVSSETNELEIVISNEGSEATTITQMTPTRLPTPRGSFNISNVLSDGPRHLAAGESVSIPMQHHAVVLNGSTMLDRQRSLNDALKATLSIVTDRDYFAAISYTTPMA